MRSTGNKLNEVTAAASGNNPKPKDARPKRIGVVLAEKVDEDVVNQSLIAVGEKSSGTVEERVRRLAAWFMAQGTPDEELGRCDQCNGVVDPGTMEGDPLPGRCPYCGAAGDVVEAAAAEVVQAEGEEEDDGDEDEDEDEDDGDGDGDEDEDAEAIDAEGHAAEPEQSAQTSGRRTKPRCEARLPDGSACDAVIDPANPLCDHQRQATANDASKEAPAIAQEAATANGVVKRDVELDRIHFDDSAQVRAYDHETVTAYAESMREGATFPPIVLFGDDESGYWLADGFHRGDAALSIGKTHIAAEVHAGTRRDALLYGVGANRTNGLRRTNADKRHCVEILLRDAEWSRKSDGWIAERVGVSQPYVSKVHRELKTVLSSPAEEGAAPEAGPDVAGDGEAAPSKPEEAKAETHEGRDGKQRRARRFKTVAELSETKKRPPGADRIDVRVTVGTETHELKNARGKPITMTAKQFEHIARARCVLMRDWEIGYGAKQVFDFVRVLPKKKGKKGTRGQSSASAPLALRVRTEKVKR